MIRRALLAGVATIGLAGGARAQCSCAANQVTNGYTAQDQNLSGAAAGQTVCVANGAGWENQEYHASGPTTGVLIDYKKGPGDPIDPTKTIGTWMISGTGTSTAVTYSYAGGSTWQYAVCSAKSKPGPGDTIGFCASSNGNSTISATLLAGQVACH
jgi:hypothetical protein